MDFTTRLQYPMVRSEGMNLFLKSKFSEIENGRYTLTRTGERFALLDQLKKCCLFSPDRVLTAFSNVSHYENISLTIGRITTFNFDGYLPEGFSKKELVVVAHSKFAGVSGDVDKGEFIFPHIQSSNSKQINITASAFDNCPSDFRRPFMFTFYLAFTPKNQIIELLHKSIMEFSQNRPDFAIVYLYTAIEAAATRLSDDGDVRITGRLHTFYKKLRHFSPSYAVIVKALKKDIEKRIIQKRGDFVHKGINLTKRDLLESYETALEFFWHYPDLENLADQLSG